MVLERALWCPKQQIDIHLSHHSSGEGQTPAGGSKFLSLSVSVTREDPVVAICR